MSARGAPGWATRRASGIPVEVHRDGNLTWIQWPRLPIALVSQPGDQAGDAVDQAGEADPVAARLAELVSTARAEGRPLGRRSVARELGVSEYRAGQLLARTNGRGTAS